MSTVKRTRKPQGRSSKSLDVLAREVAAWEQRKELSKGWRAAPEAVPNVGQSQAISLRLPKVMLHLIKQCAQREGIGYQVLIKRWLDSKLRQERSPQARIHFVPIIKQLDNAA